MSLKDFQRDNLGDYKTERIQDNSELFNRQFKNVPFLNGVHLQNIKLTAQMVTTNQNAIAHKLGRNLLGYIITKTDRSQAIALAYSDDKIAKFFIEDLLSYPVTFDVWVF